MILSQSQIERNIDWLLRNGSPAVKFLTHKNLQKMPSDSEEMINGWDEVRTCKDAEEIFSKQREDGSWCAGGSWALNPSYMQKGKPRGYDPESPKYVTTIWILPLLGDMGFAKEDERVKKACEYVLSYTSKRMEVGYRIFNDPTFYPAVDEFEPCRFSQYLVALGKVGFQNDARVCKGYEMLLMAQRDDGGWVSPHEYRAKKWTRSCPASSAFAAMALYASERQAYRKALHRACEFLLWHLSTKNVQDLQRFFYHGHSIIHELLMFSDLRIGLEEAVVRTMLDWLMTMYWPDEGCFRYSGKPRSKFSRRQDGMDARVAKYRLYHVIEDDWLTYYATRIGVNFLN